MNNEHIEKTMAFIVEHQAKFEVDIQLLQEAQARTEQIVAQTSHVAEQALQFVGQSAESVTRFAEATTEFAAVTQEGFRDVNGKINVLIDSQMRTDDQINALKDSQMHTDETVRNLATIVDRYFTDGRNGQNS